MEQIKEQLTDIKSMNMDELTEFIISLGEKKFRAKQIYEWIHVKHVESFDEMTNISKKFIQVLKDNAILISLKKEEVQARWHEKISLCTRRWQRHRKCAYEVQAWKLCMHIFAGWLQDGVQILCIHS